VRRIVARVTYFAAGTSSLDEALRQLRATNEEGLAKIDQARASIVEGGMSPDQFGILDPGKLRRESAAAEHRWALEEAERRTTLDHIRGRATADAHTAWDRDEMYFAPVLFQPLARTDGGWETALTHITQVGWRLHSWQVIGPAPEPFGYTVTLIQTLFIR